MDIQATEYKIAHNLVCQTPLCSAACVSWST